MNRLINGPQFMPVARTKDLLVQNYGKETLVYDTRTNKANDLNETISYIWSRCDGVSTIDDVARELQKKYKTTINSDFVFLALSELNRANLLADSDSALELEKVSRRKVLFKYALPTLALPVVMSLVAPPAVSAQSCAGLFAPCAIQADCCQGDCANSPAGNYCCQTVGLACGGDDDCCGFSCVNGLCA